MENIIKENLENGEKVLWSGKAASGKVMDKTYSWFYCLVILVSYGLTAAMLFLSYKATGQLKLSVALIILIVGSILPLAALYDGIKVRELSYAATDRRLIRTLGSEVFSADYKDIGDCRFRKDPSGNISLLCGKKTVKSSPIIWRGLSLFTGEVERDKKNRVQNYVMYAVNDAEGLKKALNGRVQFS